MLKYLYKTLLIAIISGSLTFQSTVAMAGNVTTDSSGTSSKTKQYHFDEVKEKNIMASLTMIAAGLIMSRMLYSYRPATGDVMIAAAAGIAFIAGEIMTNSKFDGKMKEMMAEVTKKSNREVNEEQIKRLQDLKKSYEEARDTTKKKKNMQMAAATALTISGIWALVSNYTEKGLMASCQAALHSQALAMKACEGTQEAAACALCLSGIGTYTATFNEYVVSREIIAPTPAQAAKATASLEIMNAAPTGCAGGTVPAAAATALQPVCVAASLKFKANEAVKVAPVEGVQKNNNQLIRDLLKLPPVEHMAYEDTQSKLAKGFVRYFENALNILLPKAEASGVGIGGLVGGALLLFIPGFAAWLDTWMFTPWKRSVTFAALAVTAGLAAKASGDVIDDLDAHIEKIDTILLDMNAMAAGVKTQNIINQAVKIQTINKDNSAIETYSTDGKVKTPCMTGNSSANCPKLQDQLSNMPGFANLPESFRNIASQTMGLGESLSGTNGISGSAMSSAESIGNNHAAVNRLLKKQQAKILKLSNGKIDMVKEQEKFLKAASEAARKSLKKQGMTPAGMLASIGASPIASPSADKAEKKEGTLAKAAPAAAGGAVDISASGDGKEDETLKLEFNEEKTEPVDYAMGGAGGGQDSADQYDVKTNEIGKEDGPSLFEVISKRYFKSGYPKLLEEVPSKQ